MWAGAADISPAPPDRRAGGHKDGCSLWKGLKLSSPKRAGGVEEILPDNVPVEVVEHRPDAAALNCPKCGTLMTEIGKEVRRSLMITPAQVKIREDWFYTYVCEK